MIAGKVIGTTEQHPFHAKDRGWVAANEQSPGDLITTDQDGYGVPVEALTLTDRVEFVYNLKVAKDRTYFVSYDDWDFAVWAHNAYLNKLVGDAGEDIAENVLKKNGYKSIVPVRNRSNNSSIAMVKGNCG